MDAYLTPAILVGIAGLTLQGIKAGLDLYDRIKSRRDTRRQEIIDLFVTMMQLTESAGLTQGEAMQAKLALVKLLLADTLSPEIQEAFGLKHAH